MLRNSLVAVCGVAASTAAALGPIDVYGSKFFNKDGSQFFIKGVAYQLQPEDPLVDAAQCRLDAGLMKELGANTIRVYHVDAHADHDGCMDALAEAGIYLLVDLDTFGTYIEPALHRWNATQFEQYARVMDVFQRYDNVLGFFVGNENIASRDDSPIAPLLKAAARDMKAYRDRKGYRKIPVGYSAADIKELRPMLQNYLTCGGNASEIVDFFGLNSYSWCDPSSYEQSTYNQLEEYARSFPVPILLTETGCNVPGPRLWEDQDAVFGESMAGDWSGAIVYEWIQEQNNYGIVSYGAPAGGDMPPEGFYRKGTPTPRNPDFNNLKTKWATLNPTGVRRADYNATLSTPPCPSSTPGGWWQVNGNVQLPVLSGDVRTSDASTASTAARGATDKPSEESSSSNSPSSPPPAPASGDGASPTPDGPGPQPTASPESDDSTASRASSTDKKISAMGAGLAGAVLLAAML